MSEQAAIDQGNREFWQHICGTRAAKLYGYDGDDAASIANFDKWFFGTIRIWIGSSHSTAWLAKTS